MPHADRIILLNLMNNVLFSVAPAYC